MAGATRIVIDGVSYPVDDATAVDFEEQQTLTDAQKTRARSNIGAASQDDMTSVQAAVGDVPSGSNLQGEVADLKSAKDQLWKRVDLEHKIAIPHTVALTGRYISSSGGTPSNNQYGVTDYVPFGDFNTIYYRRGQVTVSSVCYTGVYDADYNLLRTIRWGSNADAKKYADTLAYIRKRTGEAYLRFTVFLDTVTYGDFAVYGDDYPLVKNIISRTSPNAAMSMYSSFGVCGASWDCAYYIVNGSSYRKPELSWAANVARRNGNSYAVYAYQGLTTKAWLTSNYGLSALNADTAKDLYILTFGGNDSDNGAAWLGSISDITSHESYADYDDTFYGNYGKIIEQVKAHAPNALMILVMNYDPSIHSENRGNYFAAVEEIGTHYGIPVMNWAEDEWYNSFFVRDGLVSDHPTAPIYSGIAMAWERIYSLCVAKYYDYFKTYLPS